jgi:hypothetical protein
VNLDGQVSRGKVRVDAGGKVSLQGLPREAHAWASSTLSSIVAHRLTEGGGAKTACVFGPGAADHPLGREVRILGDAYHSSYRIRDGQIRCVSRQMKGQKFTITVLKDLTSHEGKLLPASFVVDFWDARTGELLRSVATHQTWMRVRGVRGFDLPRTTVTITAAKAAPGSAASAGPGISARSLSLSKYKLLQGSVR